MKDLVDLPKKVRQDLKIVPVTHMDQVLGLALRPAAEKKTRPKRTKPKKEDKSGTESAPAGKAEVVKTG